MNKKNLSNIDFFMKKLFIHLPKEIQIKILLSIPTWKPPKPKYSINEGIIKFISWYKNYYNQK